MAYTKKNTTPSKTVIVEETKELVKDVAVEEVKSAPIVNTVEKKVTKVYDGEDLIPCRSLTHGELILRGKKSEEIYTWADYDDVTEIEYRDLMALRASKSAFIFDAMFVIEDEELLEDAKWKDVKELYEKIYENDIYSMVNFDINTFKIALNKIPNGMKRSLVTYVSTLIESGEFDSIQKIKAIDEICGTDLASIL